MHLLRAVDLKIGKTTNGRGEDAKTAMAAIDRLAHHSIILEFDGRMPPWSTEPNSLVAGLQPKN
jgi:hypothetical protein